jgi:hypothetical protein
MTDRSTCRSRKRRSCGRHLRRKDYCMRALKAEEFTGFMALKLVNLSKPLVVLSTGSSLRRSHAAKER